MINKANLATKLFMVALLLSSATMAQKLPNKQEVSLRAPANIKIDGKADEWNNNFQAYNKATNLFYTLANTNEMLYLTIQAKQQDVINRIIRGGITLTVNHTTNKNDKDAISFTYPIIRDDAAFKMVEGFATKIEEYDAANKTVINVDDLNREFDAKSKLINLSGIKTISDAGVSIYNEENIKANSKFDGDLVYTYELVFPLKYLMEPNKGGEEFSYHIKINDPAELHLSKKVEFPAPVDAVPMLTPRGITNLAATDFWGEYKLAKN